MKRLINAFLLYFIVLLALTAETVDYNARSISIDKDGLILLNGNAECSSDNYTLNADSIKLNRKTRIIKAYSNITLTRNDMKIEGDSLHYNYDLDKGVVFNGRSKVDKGYFAGEQIYSVNDNEYFVINGFYTTCDSIDDPHYRFYGSRMHYYRNDRIISRPIVMYLKDVPVMALPFIVFPAVTERKSGFLMPNAGYDSYNGLYLKNLSYFWATNDFSDMTFTADIYQNRGLLLYYEARILVKPRISFNMLTNLILEPAGTKRWSIEGDYSHTLPWGFQIKAQADYLSDLGVETDYSDTTVLSLKRTAKTFISLSNTFGKYSFYVSADRNQDFATNSTSMYLPRYSGYFSKIKMFSIPYVIPNGLYFSHSHTYNNTINEDSISVVRSNSFSIKNSVDSYYSLLKFFSFSPQATVNYNAASIDSSAYLEYGANASLNTQIFGTSIFGIGPYSWFRHTLSPSVSYSYRIRSYADYPVSAPGDSTVTFNTVSAGLSNIFEAKRGKATDLLLRLNANASYDIDNDSLLPLRFGADVLPQLPVNANAGLQYNVYDKQWTSSVTTDAGFNLHNPLLSGKDIRLGASHLLSFSSDSISNNQLTCNATVPVGSFLNVTGSVLYNFKTERFVSTSISINRDLHCWDASFKIYTYGTTLKYDFRLSLKAIPDISLDKGILGPLFF